MELFPNFLEKGLFEHDGDADVCGSACFALSQTQLLLTNKQEKGRRKATLIPAVLQNALQNPFVYLYRLAGGGGRFQECFSRIRRRRGKRPGAIFFTLGRT